MISVRLSSYGCTQEVWRARGTLALRFYFTTTNSKQLEADYIQTQWVTKAES